MYNLLKDEETDDDLTTYEDIIDRLYDGYLEKEKDNKKEENKNGNN